MLYDLSITGNIRDCLDLVGHDHAFRIKIVIPYKVTLQNLNLYKKFLCKMI